MSARRLGMSRCFAATDVEIESRARMAYTAGRMSPRRPPGTGLLLRAIVGPSAFRLIDIGIRPRDARVSFFVGDIASPCEWVLISGRQEPEDFTLACARACALIVQWLRDERWDDHVLLSVMLAIAMPEPAIRHQIGRLPIDAFVYGYRLAPEFVQQRLAMFHHCDAEKAALDRQPEPLDSATQPRR